MKPIFLPALLLLGAPSADAAFEVPGFELVYTAPVETKLPQGDLRHPVEVWARMFDEARRDIDIAQFYVTPKAGEPLDLVLEALERAARRGVKVRFMAEKKFEKVSTEGLERLRRIPGLELRVIDFSALSPDGIVHAKYFIVDGATAYLGSQNFDWRSLKHIHELGLRVSERRLVRDMMAVFEKDWKAAARPPKSPPKPKECPRDVEPRPRAYLVASPCHLNPRGIRGSEQELVRLIGSATRQISIELLDYAPLDRSNRFYSPIDNALRAAQARGVRIRLLVSHWNTGRPHVDHLKSLAVLPKVEIRVVTVPQAKEGYIPYSRVIHAKYAVVDGRVLWLGTSNWSGGYMDRSRNLEAVVSDEALARRALVLHEELWNSPYAAPLDLARDYPEPKR